MGRPSPFYIFDYPTVNAGFQPELGFQKSIMVLMQTSLNAQDFTGVTLSSAVYQLKAIINFFNSKKNGSAFELVSPKPFPTLVGVQTLIYRIEIPQMVATFPNQFITFTANLSGRNITSWSFNYPAAIAQAGTYDNGFNEIERDVIQAISLREITGSAFLPDYYSWVSGIAVSGLARSSDWVYSSPFGFAVPNPLPVSPLGPIQSFSFDPLTPTQKYVSTLVGKIVQYAFETGIDQAEINSFATSLSLPDGWTLSIESNGLYLSEFTFLDGAGFGFKLVGQFTNRWLWQRFIASENASLDVFIDFFTGYLPYEPIDGKSYFNTWFDLEWVTFEPTCNEELINYSLVIKSGETYQFNILPDQGNYWDLDSVNVGIFDKDSNFIQKIGIATLPACKIALDYTMTTSEITGLLAASGDVVLVGFDCEGNEVSILVTIPNASITRSNGNTYGTTVVSYINTNTSYTASYEFNGAIFILRLSLIDTSTPIVRVDLTASAGSFEITGAEITRCANATQLQATVTIPALLKGCYRYGLYTLNNYAAEIYSMSQLLSLDDFECFTQILEYSSRDRTIDQGFEYYDTWVQKVRVPIGPHGEEQPSIEDSEYRETTGHFRRSTSKSDLSVSLHSDWNDKATQRAIYAATQHDRFVLNQVPLFVFGDLELNHQQDFSTESSYFELAQTRFKAKIQNYQPLKNDCINC